MAQQLAEPEDCRKESLHWRSQAIFSDSPKMLHRGVGEIVTVKIERADQYGPGGWMWPSSASLAESATSR
jgi:hypothetical protein